MTGYDFDTPPRPPAPPAQFASVLHLTDLHLNRVYIQREQRKNLLWDVLALPRELTEAVPEILGSHDVIGKATTTLAVQYILAMHEIGNERVWRSFRRFLARAVVRESQRGEVVVAQTGDAEAFGCDEDGHFLAYEELHNDLWPELRDLGAKCYDVYGNHDIWPSLFMGRKFLDEHRHAPDRLAGEHPRLLGPWDVEGWTGTHGAEDPKVPSDPPVHIHRVNTVDPSPEGAFLAQGRVCQEPLPNFHLEVRPVAERLGTALRTDNAVHLVLTHHPLYAPRLPRRPAKFLREAIIRVLRDADEVRSVLGSNALVLSGHLHRPHPKQGASCTLPQVVSTTPTVVGFKTHRATFSQYTLHRKYTGTKSKVTLGDIRVDRHTCHYTRSQRFDLNHMYVEHDLL